MRYFVEIGGRERVVEIQAGKEGVRVLVDGVAHPVDVVEVGGTGLFSLLVDGASHAFAARFEDGEVLLAFHDREVGVRIEDEPTRLARTATGGRRGGAGPARVRSVMPGIVREIRVAPGAAVVEGTALLILEAMKMENEIRAPHEGVVEEVHVRPGQPVEKGALLVTLAPPRE